MIGACPGRAPSRPSSPPRSACTTGSRTRFGCPGHRSPRRAAWSRCTAPARARRTITTSRGRRSAPDSRRSPSISEATATARDRWTAARSTTSCRSRRCCAHGSAVSRRPRSQSGARAWAAIWRSCPPPPWAPRPSSRSARLRTRACAADLPQAASRLTPTGPRSIGFSPATTWPRPRAGSRCPCCCSTPRATSRCRSSTRASSRPCCGRPGAA